MSHLRTRLAFKLLTLSSRIIYITFFRRSFPRIIVQNLNRSLWWKLSTRNPCFQYKIGIDWPWLERHRGRLQANWSFSEHEKFNRNSTNGTNFKSNCVVYTEHVRLLVFFFFWTKIKNRNGFLLSTRVQVENTWLTSVESLVVREKEKGWGLLEKCQAVRSSLSVAPNHDLRRSEPDPYRLNLYRTSRESSSFAYTQQG